MSAVSSGDGFEFASNELRENKEVQLASALKNGVVTLQPDKDVVMAAVSQNGRALQQGDVDISMAAVRNKQEAFAYLHENETFVRFIINEGIRS